MNHNQEPPRVTPLDSQRRYQPFYLTLLILSTIGTLIGLAGAAINIPVVLRYLSTAPIYTFASVATIIVTIGSTVALALLWLKRPFGIWLKLSAYAFSLVILIVMALSVEPVIQANIQSTISTSPDRLSRDTIDAIVHVSTYIGLGLSAAVNIVFGILWYKAWRRQERADAELTA